MYVPVTDGPGLSPRVRGNLHPSSFGVAVRGPIPACAGEPRSAPRSGGWPWAYPRVCGGTLGHQTQLVQAYGLSPRVRGNRLQGRHPIRPPGPIPACAGEPPALRHAAGLGLSYPRVCGGTSQAGSRITCPPGLSPRVRGNRAAASSVGVGFGPIPACAGEPWPSCRTGPERRAYPRVCGGTHRVWARAMIPYGLSPRVRGNLGKVHRSCRRRGPIPACAGEPPTLPPRQSC